MSAVGTTLLQSPGCNEGKARNETLGTHGQKKNELRRSGTFSASIGIYPFGSAAPLGLNKCIDYFTQGLRPGLCRSIALTGLLYVFSINILYYFDAVALTKGQLLALLQGLNDGG